ncbi:hypothetical protein BOX15_Mlig014497g2, partial [Macrostomum lignano]
TVSRAIMNPSGGNNQPSGGYGWSPGTPRYSTPRGGAGQFTPRQPRYHAGGYYSGGGPGRGGSRGSFSGSPYGGGRSPMLMHRGGGYRGSNSSSYSNNSYSSGSVYYTPPTNNAGGNGGFRYHHHHQQQQSSRGSFNRKRDWSTASGGDGAGRTRSFAKPSMLMDPWANLAPVLVPEAGAGGVVAGLVAKSGQTHTFLTPKAAAEAAGETSSLSSAFTSPNSLTFTSFNS